MSPSVELACEVEADEPALPAGDPVATSEVQPVTIAISDRLDASADLVYRPPSLIVGVGASRGITADELDELITTMLADASLAVGSVRGMGSPG